MFLLYHGEDEFSAREELARLCESGAYDFNQDTFRGDEADITQIRTVCDTLPFLSERRLVVVSGLPKPKKRRADEDEAGGDDVEDEGEGEGEEEPSEAPSPPAGRGKKGKAGAMGPRAFAQALASYAPLVPETTTLVVIVGKLDPASPLLKAAKLYGRAQEFPPLKGAPLEQWITRRAQAAEAGISQEAARLLMEWVGNDLRLLTNEIAKLSVAVGRGGRIGVEQVRALTLPAGTLNVFALTDALAARDPKRALALLHELLANGMAPLAIVGLAASQTRTLLQVKALSERGMKAFQIAETAGIAPYSVEKALPLARRFSFAQLEALHRALLDVDISLKSSRISPELALDLLTLQFGATATDTPPGASRR